NHLRLLSFNTDYGTRPSEHRQRTSGPPDGSALRGRGVWGASRSHRGIECLQAETQHHCSAVCPAWTGPGTRLAASLRASDVATSMTSLRLLFVEPDRPKILIDIVTWAHLPAFDIASMRHNPIAP